MTDKKYYSAKDLAERYGFKSHKTIEQMASRNEMPRPVKIGRNNRWDSDHIDQWENEKSNGAELVFYRKRTIPQNT